MASEWRITVLDYDDDEDGDEFSQLEKEVPVWTPFLGGFCADRKSGICILIV
jgi:hypothetical protein